MKIVNSEKDHMTLLEYLDYGDLFRYQDELFIKVFSSTDINAVDLTNGGAFSLKNDACVEEVDHELFIYERGE